MQMSFKFFCLFCSAFIFWWLVLISYIPGFGIHHLLNVLGWKKDLNYFIFREILSM